MRKTRYMSLLFLVLSFCFFLVPEFQQGLGPNVRMWFYSNPDEWLTDIATIPPARLQEIARQAEEEKDAQSLAFVAVSTENREEGRRLADAAVEIDRELTWIYALLLDKHHQDGMPPEWIEKLRAWDPDNAYSYLHDAEHIWEKEDLQRFGSGGEGLDALAQATEWREAMRKAFAAPRYDSYMTQHFELERTALQQHELAHTAVMLVALNREPISSLPINLRYVNLVVEKFGKEAEQRGRGEEALRQYWSVMHMGARMQTRGSTATERLIGDAFIQIASERLLPLLRKMNRADEAAAVEALKNQLEDYKAGIKGEDPLSNSSNYRWAAALVQVFAGWVAIFGVLAVASFGYVSLQRYVLHRDEGKVFQLFALMENYTPILWFIGCMGFYLAYYPYAQNFEYYLTAGGRLQNFESFYANIFPIYGLPPGLQFLPVQNPFRLYGLYAAGGLAILSIVIGWLRHHRTAPE